MVLSASPGRGNQPPENKVFSFTVFPDNLARKKRQETLDLAGLEALILATHAPRKDKLPLLKMALFGDVPSTKNCLRHDTNMLDITGIEVEHDGEKVKVSFKQAVKILMTAGLCCLIYSTPSHVPIERERWRVLLPLSKPRPNSERRHLVELVNGLFDGALAPESFKLSQAFYFGVVDGASFHIKRLDGVFVDLAGLTKAISPAPVTGKGTKSTAAVAAGHTLTDLQALQKEYLRTREGWHNMMLTITSSLVAKQFTDNEIQEFCADVCDLGRDDPEMLEMLRSARDKFGSKPIPVALKALLKPTGQVEPEPAPSEPDVADAPPEPAQNAILQVKTNWLLSTHGHMPTEGRVVILHRANNNCLLRLTDFRDAFAHWSEPMIGARGDPLQKRLTATSGWLTNPNRLRIEGVRMAPDQPFPVYWENEHCFKNTYRRPRHSGTGDVTPFLTFLERLIPDAQSRAYQLNWLAYKVRHPETPGCAIMHVADNDQGTEGAREGNYGTGRGILFSIARALLGNTYCSEQDFRILDGSSGQSVYTDWQHGNILVTCDESPSSPTYYRRSERVVAYEILKRIIDPAIAERTFTAKYRGAFSGRSHCSIWIASNHIDALAIPSNDRRISVIRNGRTPTRDEIAAIVAWRSHPGSLAALERYLNERDLSGFDFYQPIWTEAKASMVDAAISEVEETVLELMEDDERGLVFLLEDLTAAVRLQHPYGEPVTGHLADARRRHVVLAPTTGKGPRRLRVGSTQRKLYCFRCHSEKVSPLTEEEAREEALRWRPGIRGFSGLGSRSGSQE